jgi:hypothetical protein
MGRGRLKILHKNCDLELSQDKSLPLDSYLVSYFDEGNITFDIVKSSSQTSIFDYYYDTYGKGSPCSIKWTNGKINPKLWGQEKPKKKK